MSLTDSKGRGYKNKGSQSITPSYVFCLVEIFWKLKLSFWEGYEIYTQTYHTISDCFNNINIIF